MKHFLNDRKSTLCNFRPVALVGAFAACFVALPSEAQAQNLPVSCFDTPSKMDVFVSGEGAGQRQVEQMWKTVEQDCLRLPELSGTFIQQVGLLIEAINAPGIGQPLLCRLGGQLNGLTVGWSRVITGCLEPVSSGNARSSG